MTDLAGFLLARVAEDEAAWSQTTDLATRPDFAKLSRHMLAECEAKRRIVALHDQDMPGWCVVCNIPGDQKGRPHGCTTVRLLALPYAGHPDWRDEWRP